MQQKNNLLIVNTTDNLNVIKRFVIFINRSYMAKKWE